MITAADIPGAMRLKEAAGWNQTEQDWLNLLHLAPDGCFGIACDGALAATASAVCFGRDLAWIGMVLTHPDFRGRGYARRLLEHALGYLTSRSVECIKLDATEMGRPLYRKLGFEDEAPIERWARSPQANASRSEENRFRLLPFKLSDWIALDRECSRVDRSALLATLALPGAAAIPGEGYAMGRPGTNAAYFGPCICRSTRAARALLAWFVSQHPGETLYWDLLPANTDAVGLAQELGFTPLRRLVRMALAGSKPIFQNYSRIFATAGFEYG